MFNQKPISDVLRSALLEEFSFTAYFPLDTEVNRTRSNPEFLSFKNQIPFGQQVQFYFSMNSNPDVVYIGVFDIDSAHLPLTWNGELKKSYKPNFINGYAPSFLDVKDRDNFFAVVFKPIIEISSPAIGFLMGGFYFDAILNPDTPNEVITHLNPEPYQHGFNRTSKPSKSVFVKQGKPKKEITLDTLTKEEQNHLSFIKRGCFALIEHNVNLYGFKDIEGTVSEDGDFMFLVVETVDKDKVKVTIPRLKFHKPHAGLIRREIMKRMVGILPRNTVLNSIFKEWFGVTEQTIKQDLKAINK